MALATYSDLQSKIADTLDDNTLTSTIPDFITQAEDDIRNDPRIRFLPMETRATASLSTSSHYLADTTGFAGIKRMQINGTTAQHEIKIVTPTILNAYYTSTTGRPEFAAVVGGEFEFNRIPDDDYTVEILYYKLTPLSDSDTTNELFPTYPNMYLYGSLVHAAVYLMEDETRFERMYERAVMKAQLADKKMRRTAQNQMRSRHVA